MSRLTKNKFVLWHVALLAVGLMAVSANAATVTMTFTGCHPNQNVTLHADTGTDGVYEKNTVDVAGVYNFNVTATDWPPLSLGPLKAFCMDINDGLSFASGTWMVRPLSQAPMPTTYTGGTTVGATKETALQKLYVLYYVGATANNSLESAAFQVSIWEIVNEHNPLMSLNISSGSFKIDAGAVATRAQEMLDSLASFTFAPDAQRPNLVAFVNDGVQDQMWLAPGGAEPPPAPEPITLLGLMLGFGGIGAYWRKRRMP